MCVCRRRCDGVQVCHQTEAELPESDARKARLEALNAEVRAMDDAAQKLIEAGQGLKVRAHAAARQLVVMIIAVVNQWS